MSNITPQEAEKIAEEAYIFSFPMLMGYRALFGAFLVPSLPSYQGPLNQICGEPQTLDHTFKEVISPNADTPYSSAGLDLRAEPLVVDVPDVTDRYYVLQLENLYGDNEHYVGSRATGTDGGSYLLVGPRWEGDIPEGFKDVLRFETDLVFLIGRSQLLGADDVEALGKVMSAYRLRGLSELLGRPAPEAPPVDWPVWSDEASRDERFICHVNFLLSFCQPPHPSEVGMLKRFSQIGIAPGAAFDAESLDDDRRAALRSGVETARSVIAQKVENVAEKIDGWMMTDALGNRAFFDGDYLLRAAGAMGAWGGNDKIEAAYPMTHEDADAQPLDGAHRYRLRLTTTPPAKAFWSLTIYDKSYDGTAGYLVENPIGRYLINSTTEGLSYGGDGSLEIVIQRIQPDTPEELANWLPAPEGPFYLAFRIYWPEQAALDGTWTPPPVERVD